MDADCAGLHDACANPAQARELRLDDTGASETPRDADSSRAETPSDIKVSTAAAAFESGPLNDRQRYVITLAAIEGCVAIDDADMHHIEYFGLLRSVFKVAELRKVHGGVECVTADDVKEASATFYCSQALNVRFGAVSYQIIASLAAAFQKNGAILHQSLRAPLEPHSFPVTRSIFCDPVVMGDLLCYDVYPRTVEQSNALAICHIVGYLTAHYRMPIAADALAALIGYTLTPMTSRYWWRCKHSSREAHKVMGFDIGHVYERNVKTCCLDLASYIGRVLPRTTFLDMFAINTAVCLILNVPQGKYSSASMPLQFALPPLCESLTAHTFTNA